jgi:uncharacterized OB-fold protein
MSTTQPPLPPVEVTPDSRPYWTAAEAGKLVIKQCTACGENYFYPRPFCPFCLSDKTIWLEASGKATIYSYTVVARAPFFRVPAMVTLDEGPTLLSAIVDCDPDKITIGQRVTVTFLATESGPPLPAFRPE